MKCKFCGGSRFMGHQMAYHDILVDEHGNFEEEVSCYDSDHPYGPFTCQGCGAEYERLTEDEYATEKPDGIKVRETVTEMACKLAGMSVWSPQLLYLAFAVRKLVKELKCNFEEAYLLAMAIYHPKGICMTADDAKFSDYDYVESLAFLPAKVSPAMVIQCVHLGPEAFNSIIGYLACYCRAKNSNDFQSAELYEAAAVVRIDKELHQSDDAEKRIKASKEKFANTGFIWYD